MHSSNDPLVDSAIAHLENGIKLELEGAKEIDFFCGQIACLYQREGGTAEFLAWSRDVLGLKPAAAHAKYKIFLPIVQYMAKKSGRTVRDSKISKIAGALTVWLEYHPDIPAEKVADWMGQHGGHEGVYDSRPQPPPWLKLPENAPAGQQFVVRADTPEQEQEVLDTAETKTEAIRALRDYCSDGWNDDEWGDEPDDDFTVIQSYFSRERVKWSISLEALDDDKSHDLGDIRVVGLTIGDEDAEAPLRPTDPDAKHWAVQVWTELLFEGEDESEANEFWVIHSHYSTAEAAEAGAAALQLIPSDERLDDGPFPIDHRETTTPENDDAAAENEVPGPAEVGDAEPGKSSAASVEATYEAAKPAGEPEPPAAADHPDKSSRKTLDRVRAAAAAAPGDFATQASAAAEPGDAAVGEPEPAGQARDESASTGEADACGNNMRSMKAKMLQDGIARTRQQLDDLVRECHLSEAKEFRAGLDAVWSAIENTLADVPAELVLLREHNAALNKELVEIKREKCRLEVRVRELTCQLEENRESVATSAAV